jgi:hypothetical protein
LQPVGFWPDQRGEKSPLDRVEGWPAVVLLWRGKELRVKGRAAARERRARAEIQGPIKGWNSICLRGNGL